MAKETYNDYFKMKQHTLYPGEYAFSRDALIHTITGDCCLLCLHDPVTRSAGVCSFLLPVSGKKDDDRDLMRQSIAFIELLMADFVKAGADRQRLNAKIFGLGQLRLSADVSRANSLFVEHYLMTERIRLVSTSTGGGTFRELFFVPQSGCAFLRNCNGSMESETWKKSESDYITSVHSSFTTKFVLFNQELSVS